MPYVQTSRLNTIDLLDPNLDGIPLEELVRALAHINRFTGHAGPYSVAQHCVHAACVVHDQGFSRGVQAGALMHDLHEAVIGDASSPIKAILGPTWEAFERLHMAAVERRFNVRVREVPAVKVVDARLCVTEADQLLGGRVGPGWPDVKPIDWLKIPSWTPIRAEREFLSWADRLGCS